MERSNHETKDLQWFGYKDTFLALLRSSSHLLESFLHYVNKLPYGGENLTHQFTHHNYVTTYSHLLHNYFTPIHYLITTLLHTYLLHTNFLHTYLLHTNLLHINFLHTNLLPSSSSSQLTTNQSHYIHTQLNYLLTNIHN